MLRAVSSSRLLALVGLLPLAAACGPELDLRGNLQRVIGERITLELVSGDPDFGETLSMADSERTFSATELRSVRQGSRLLSFAVPTGVRVGEARVKIDKGDSAAAYDIPLQISRLAVSLDDSGTVEVAPLPGGRTAPQDIAAGSRQAKVSLSPSGGELLLLKEDRLERYLLGGSMGQPSLSTVVQNAVAIAATNGGALVATDKSISLFSFQAGEGTVLEGTLAIANAVAIAVDATSSRAVALSHCDLDHDGTADGDCVTQIVINGASTRIAGDRIEVDDTPDATLVAMRSDGTAAVLADPSHVYGVLFTGSGQVLAPRSWNDRPAQPVAIDRAPSELGDLFCIADAAGRTLMIVGFLASETETETSLRHIAPPALQASPVSLSFGRGTDLYVASGTEILKYDIRDATVEPVKVLETTAPIVTLAIQH